MNMNKLSLFVQFKKSGSKELSDKYEQLDFIRQDAMAHIDLHNEAVDEIWKIERELHALQLKLNLGESGCMQDIELLKHRLKMIDDALVQNSSIDVIQTKLARMRQLEVELFGDAGFPRVLH